MGVAWLSHIGICVADLERSRRFYQDLLGFEERSRLDVAGEPTDRLLGLSGVKLRALYLERDGTRIELLSYDAPGTVGEPEARPMNGLGLTHLSLRVDDLDALVPTLEAAGGRVLADSRVEMGPVKCVFLVDPDGTRLELIEAPGPNVLPGTSGGPA